MKRPPYYPLIVAAFPVLTVFSLNLAMVPLADLWRPLSCAIGGAAIIWLLLVLAFRNIEKAAILTLVVLVLFFSYGPTQRMVPALALQCADISIIGLTVLLLVRTRSDLKVATRSLNFGAIVLILLPLVQIFRARPPGQHEAFLKVSLPVAASRSTVRERPDIFFVILDGYGRADQLQRVMGYSDQAFIDGLRGRGFYVADRSHSNYVQTQLSLTATLNLTFLQNFPKVFPPASDDRKPLGEGMDRSFAADYLQRLGYQYISVTSGFDEVKFSSASLRYDRPLKLSMLESTLVQQTPITIKQSALESLFEDRRKSLIGAFRNLASLSHPTASPRFVVAHILAPHPPFVFDATGKPVRQHVMFGFWDGSHYMESGGTPQSYKDGYSGQVQYLNDQVIEVVDALQAGQGKRKPVIIIEGDHGSKRGLNQEVLEKTDLRECFGNLMALYVPDPVKSKLYPEISPSNTFRILFDGLFGEKLPLLPDRSFYSPFSRPYRFTDITTQVAD